jgi:hypothetical protein
MTIAQALRRGAAQLNAAKGLWFVFYAVTTALALSIAGAAIAIGFDSLGASAWAQELAGNLSFQWPAELFANHGLSVFLPALVAALAVFALAAVAHVFLLGGAIQLFSSRERFSMQAFFAACGKHFGRLVKLTLVSLVFYGLVMAIGSLLSFVGDKAWGEGSVQTPLVYWGWFRLAVLACLYGYVNLVFDYARIRMISTGSRGAWRAAFTSFRFVWRNRGRTIGLYAALWLIALVIIAASLAASRVAQRSILLVLLLLLVRQILVIGKVWSRLLFYAAQCEMYHALQPPIIIVPPPAQPEPEPEIAPQRPPFPEPEPQWDGSPAHNLQTEAAVPPAGEPVVEIGSPDTGDSPQNSQ